MEQLPSPVVLHQAGVPDDNIITLFEDGIAYNDMNPFPGEIYNELYQNGGTNINVYEGVVKDYTGENATKQNLMDVLSGNSTTSGSGKTLLSTENDNVFIFYDGPGGAGMIGMPDGNPFYASDLTTVLTTMTSKRMFKNLVFFLSSCYSGSMIENQILPQNMYVVTSTVPYASSFSCLDDPFVGTYLSSCFSHGWIHSIDIHGQNVEFGTIYEGAYNYTTNASQDTPCEYGNLSIKSITWSAFLEVSSMNDNPSDLSSQIPSDLSSQIPSDLSSQIPSDLSSQISGPCVVIEIEEGTESNEVSDEELVTLINIAVEIEREQLRVVVERDEEGNINRVYVFVNDEDSADSIVDYIKQCNDSIFNK